ncbi:ATP-binding protein [Bacteroides sp.]|uniref:ATP-binding protein n=1 Tax=Bacteroides sp. TaxID=29523 RepID=UPI002633643A|nr:ATP-binding protein [Bacteroides sp.]MDD3040644.1 ATP-binding protein [Bacteroides sp.]
MLNHVTSKNFGPLKDVKWSDLQGINLIIGENGSGKSFLLKALYTSMRTIEEYKRGDDKRTEMEILAEKLYWTFQTEKIGDLVSKSANEALFCEISLEDKVFSYSFGKDTNKQIQTLRNQTSPRPYNSIFLPSKEVLSLYHIILESREKDRLFGFDDTYLDLVRALALPRKGGKNYAEFADSRKALEKILNGKVEYDEISKRWLFKKGNQKFAIGVTAEGVKKIAILDSLLANRYLEPNSIVFIDEPESALHPSAISDFLDIIAVLAERGLQFFLASHSYFVIKKLCLIAKQKNMSIPLISLHNTEEQKVQYDDLQDGVPNNPIINESIRLYEEEIAGVLG